MYYLLNSTIGVDEDNEHEFKMHRNMSAEEIPPWAVFEENNKLKRSRQPVSKTICAFLNTGKGGVCYLGVLNDGTVKGIKLTNTQKDHMIVSLNDTLSRFIPGIQTDQVKMVFVPVYCSKDNIPNKELEEKSFFDQINETDELRFTKHHVLRTSAYCWCDKLAVVGYNEGIVPRSYVIEISVLPWTCVETVSQQITKMPLYPIYQSETGLTYMRRQSSNVQISVQDVYAIAKNQVSNFYAPEITELEAKLEKLRCEMEKKLSKSVDGVVV